ncbi:MAG: zinc ribbon domain-containing protein [Candidatus Lokiarchaeota archaeon]|nr:zinc ribbon domain-containing protein [Candidatus Lokiarchaeota archaeon]
MFCQNCGSEIDQNYQICPYCGQNNRSSDIRDDKDIKIQELEQKVAELEQAIKEGSKSMDKKWPFNLFQPWFFIFPLVFVVLFFVLFMVLISIR